MSDRLTTTDRLALVFFACLIVVSVVAAVWQP